MKKYYIYPLKIWLTAVALGPIIQELVAYITGQPPKDSPFFTYIVAVTIAGLMYSAPSFLVLLLAAKLLYNFKLSFTVKKIIFTILGIILSTLPFYILFGPPDFIAITHSSGFLLMVLSYTLSIIAGIWLYKIDPLY